MLDMFERANDGGDERSERTENQYTKKVENGLKERWKDVEWLLKISRFQDLLHWLQLCIEWSERSGSRA